MAINVQTIPLGGSAIRVRSLSPRVPAFAIVILTDVFALVLPSAFVPSHQRAGYAFAVLSVALLALHGHYRSRISPMIAREAGALVGCCAVAAVAVAAFSGSEASQTIRVGLAATGLLLGGRTLSYGVVRFVRSRAGLEPTLIIGAGAVGVEMAQTLLAHPEYGMVPVGFLDNFDDAELPLPVLGTVRSLDVVLREYEVRRVIIAFGAIREPEMVPVVRACDAASVDIHVLPRFFELGATAEGREADDIWGMPIVRLPRPTLRPSAWWMKRSFDVVFGSIFLVLASPLLGVLALGVKLSSPGPVFFRQKRIGRYGRVIDVLKFRSMHVNNESDTQWSVVHDDRTTPIGRFMRRTSLDELPQLINVVRGEMSLVGPRPERPYFVTLFANEVPRYADRHRVPVGMTGWAQVHGLRGDTSIAQRARFDNQYIETWSLWRDIVTLARTASAVVRDAISPTEGHEDEDDDTTVPLAVPIDLSADVQRTSSTL